MLSLDVEKCKFLQGSIRYHPQSAAAMSHRHTKPTSESTPKILYDGRAFETLLPSIKHDRL